MLCRGVRFVGVDEVMACSLHTCRVIRAATLKLAWVGEDLAGRWVVVVENKRCMDGWMDLMSGGGWVSAPHIQFENALFFYNKTGFLRSTPQSCIFSFFPFDMASLSPCNVRVLVLLRLYVWMYLLQPIKLDIFIVFIFWAKR